eukprot:86298-Amphidinium_carterae.1
MATVTLEQLVNWQLLPGWARKAIAKAVPDNVRKSVLLARLNNGTRRSAGPHNPKFANNTF